MNLFSRFMNDESGATAIEYGLIAAIVGIGIIAGLKQLTTALNGTFGSVSGSLSGTGGTGTTTP